MKQGTVLLLVFVIVVALAQAIHRSHSHRWAKDDRRSRSIRHSRHNYDRNSESRRLSNRHRDHHRRYNSDSGRRLTHRSKHHAHHKNKKRVHKRAASKHLKSHARLHTKQSRRKLSLHHESAHRVKDRQLDYPNLPGSEYRNPYLEPPSSVDSQTQSIIDYHQGPNMGGAVLLQSSLFLRDGNYTKWIRDQYRAGKLKIVQRDYSKIDENYYEGTTAYIGDRQIPDEFAVGEMNFEQYKHHLTMTMTADREDMKYLNRYNEEIVAQNLMLNLRDTRDRIYQSNLDMENEIYREIGALHRKLRNKDLEFRRREQINTQEMQARNYGKPFYLSKKDRFDIFTE
jgi:hypothetical protein